MKLNHQILLTAIIASVSICFAISIFVKGHKEASINALNIQYIELTLGLSVTDGVGKEIDKSLLSPVKIRKLINDNAFIEFLYFAKNNIIFNEVFRDGDIKSSFKSNFVNPSNQAFQFVDRHTKTDKIVYEYARRMNGKTKGILHVGITRDPAIKHYLVDNVYLNIVYIFSIFSVSIAALYWAFRLTHLIDSSTRVIRALRSDAFDGELYKKEESITKNKKILGIPEFRHLVESIELLAATWAKNLEETKKKEQYLRATLDSIGDGVITTDTHGIVTSINRVAEKMTGWECSEAIGKQLGAVFKICNIDTKSGLETPINPVICSDSMVSSYVNTTLISRFGKECQISNSIESISDDNGVAEGIIIVFHDDTEQFELRTKSQNATDRLESILNDMQTMVGIIDLEGRLIYANNTPLQITGVSHEDVLNKIFSQAIWFYFDQHLSTLIQQEVDTALSGDSTLNEHQVFTLSGLLWVSIAMHPVFDGEGAVLEVVVEAHDISDRKRAEEHLRRSQKMEALGKLTGGIAHDYNNMLGVIQGYADLLEDEIDNNPELHNYITQIINASQRSVNLTRKLLNFSRKESIESSVVNINNILIEQREMLEKSVTVSILLEFSLADDLWNVLLEAGDFEDAILNLSINCAHAIGSDDGGVIRYVSENKHIDSDSAHALQLEQGQYVTLKISDNGCGMSVNTRHRIFEPFFTTKGDKGTGLGLSQVYSFVKRNGGAISVYSEEGRGTEMMMYFPRTDSDEVTEEHQMQDETLASSVSESILVVDDEPALVELASMLLTKHGYKVFTANSAKQALLLLDSTPIDLLLSDVIMPGMGGYELAAIVRKKFPLIKIQMASGFSSETQVKDKTIVSKYVIAKPYRKNTLLRTVRRVLDQNF